MTNADKIQACVDALRRLEKAQAELGRLISDDGGQARRNWVLLGPLPFGSVEFSVRLSFAEVLALTHSNRRWAEGKLRGLLGTPDIQQWKSTRVTGERRPWWRRVFDL
jgi:hypothetical protein